MAEVEAAAGGQAGSSADLVEDTSHWGIPADSGDLPGIVVVEVHSCDGS